MAEIKVGKNESLDSTAPFQTFLPKAGVLSEKYGNVNTMKNRAYGERKNLKQHGNGSIEHNRKE